MSEENTENNDAETNLDDFAAEFFGGNKPDPEPSTETEENANSEETEEETEQNTEEKDDVSEDSSDDLATNDDETGEKEAAEEEEKSKDEPSEGDEPKPKRNRAQERITELNAKFREQERLRLKAEAELAELKKARSEEKEDKPTEKTEFKSSIDPAAKNEDGTPKYKLGEYDPQYLRDVIDEALENDRAEREQERVKNERETAVKEAQEALQAQWQERVAVTEEKHPDFMESTQALGEVFDDIDPAYGEYLGSTLMQMEHGPEVAYYLSQNIEEAHDIVNGGPGKATMALAKLEVKLTGSLSEENKSKGKKVTKAPTPPPVNKGNTAVKASTPVDTDNLDAFEREFFKSN